MSDHPTKQTTDIIPDPTLHGEIIEEGGPLRLNERDAGFVEGYAKALDDMIVRLGHESMSDKSYDPMTVSEDGTKMHSYAFDMLDGGRHHPVSDYRDVEQISQVLLDEAVAWLKTP